ARHNEAEGPWVKRLAHANAVRHTTIDLLPDANTNGVPPGDANTDTHARSDTGTAASADPSPHAGNNTSAHAYTGYRVRAGKWQRASVERPNLPLRRTEHL